MKQPNWTRILTILLVILAAFAVLYIVGTILGRFRHPIFIFTMGALVAYILAPVVGRIELVVRARWLAILLSYIMLAVLLGSVSVLLFTPFIQQSQSLVDNLQTPSTGSLTTFRQVRDDTSQLAATLQQQRNQYHTSPIPATTVTATNQFIQKIERDLNAVRSGTLTRTGHGTHAPAKGKSGRLSPSPPAQTQVPPLYVSSIQKQLAFTAGDYASATGSALLPPAAGSLASALRHAHKTASLASQNYQTVTNTPILLLRGQAWLDQHNVPLDLHSEFGSAAAQVSNQGSTVLNNAVTVLQEFANALLNIALILIIAFYLLSDGKRLIASGMNVVPGAYRDQVWYFVSSLDRVLGGYIRGQVFLSALAGVLAGAGAGVLGVPYPLLIGIVTFILEAIPVIGPMAAIFPGVVISLFFMPVITTAVLLIWNVVFQQLVTNILGPRIMGMAVGIHPLEAMLAVLVGYPLGGFVGAFLAVPVMGILHILIREFYNYAVHGRKLPTADPSDVLESPDSGPTEGRANRQTTAGASRPDDRAPALTRLFAMLSMRRGDRANPEGKTP